MGDFVADIMRARYPDPEDAVDAALTTRAGYVLTCWCRLRRRETNNLAKSRLGKRSLSCPSATAQSS